MFKLHLKKKQRKEITRITEYLISGGAYFWSGYAVFFVCDQLLGLNLWWAKLIANIAGWVVNYTLQRYWVFKNPSLAKHQTEVTTRYIALTLFNFLLDYGIVRGLQIVGITPYIGQFISASFFTVWNYLWYKLWVFPQKFTPARVPARITPARVVAHHALGHSGYHAMRKRPVK
jgi:putative flippase GtrA